MCNSNVTYSGFPVELTALIAVITQGKADNGKWKQGCRETLVIAQ